MMTEVASEPPHLNLIGMSTSWAESQIRTASYRKVSNLSLTARNMHKTLEEQLRRLSGDPDRDLPGELIEAVDRAYHRADAVEAELRAQLQEGRELQAIGRIAGGIAHDFNNLLTVIKGYCDLGLRLSSQDDGPVPKALQQISEATDRAVELTIQLLALRRRSKLDSEQLDLGRVLNELQPMLRRLAKGGSSLEVRPSGFSAPMLADRGRLQQMLLNAVISAFEAQTQPSTVSLRVTHWAESPELHTLLSARETARSDLLLVVEHGDPSSSSPGSTSSTDSPAEMTASPADLTTLRALVEELNGELVMGDGSTPTWVVCLPRHQQSVVEPVPAAGAVLPGARILVVEDEEPVRLMLEALLTDQGHSVTLAPGPEDALAHFETHSSQIDLLVTDIVMPGMLGPKMAQMMKRERPDLAVLFISGYDPDARERRGAPAPGGAFLQKPFDAATLNLKIREVLSSP